LDLFAGLWVPEFIESDAQAESAKKLTYQLVA
jgi:hypothetical protein